MKTTLCPKCRGFRNAQGKMTEFTYEGVTHVVPEMWLLGRQQMMQREIPFVSVEDAYMAVLLAWVDHCRRIPSVM